MQSLFHHRLLASTAHVLMMVAMACHISIVLAKEPLKSEGTGAAVPAPRAREQGDFLPFLGHWVAVDVRRNGEAVAPGGEVHFVFTPTEVKICTGQQGFAGCHCCPAQQ